VQRYRRLRLGSRSAVDLMPIANEGLRHGPANVPARTKDQDFHFEGRAVLVLSREEGVPLQRGLES